MQVTSTYYPADNHMHTATLTSKIYTNNLLQSKSKFKSRQIKKLVICSSNEKAIFKLPLHTLTDFTAHLVSAVIFAFEIGGLDSYRADSYGSKRQMYNLALNFCS